MKGVFISYSWDNENHKEWVMNLNNRLKSDGVLTTIDRDDLRPGDSIPVFMEQSIKNAEVILLILTPEYKRKSDERLGGVGYEGSIITGEILNGQNKRKYIPVLVSGDWKSSSPIWATGRRGVNLSDNPYSEEEYRDLLEVLPTRTKDKADDNSELLYSLSGKQLNIINCLYGTSGKTIAELAVELNYTKSSVQYQLKGLLSQGVLIKKGLRYICSFDEDSEENKLLKRNCK